MPKEYQNYDISFLNEDETIWETIEGEKYMHLLQVFFYNPKNVGFNDKYKNLNLSSGFIVEPDRIYWKKYFGEELPKKFKILHYPYKLKHFISNQLVAEEKLRKYIFSKCNKKILKSNSYAYSNENTKKELDKWSNPEEKTIEIELRLSKELIINFPNACILIFGEKNSLNEIKLKNKGDTDCAIEFKILSLEDLIILKNLKLEDNKNNKKENLKHFNCDEIGYHLCNFITEVKKNKSITFGITYFLTIYQKKIRGEITTKILDLPGGSRDLGEYPRETAIRELKEETGITKDKITICNSYTLKNREFNKRHSHKLYIARYQKPKDEEPKDNESHNIYNIDNIDINQDEVEIEV